MSQTSQTSHSSQPPAAPHKYGELNVGSVAFVGAFGAIVTFVTVAFTQAWYYNQQQAFVAQQQYGRKTDQMQTYRAQQDQSLETLQWNPDGTVTVPIERALEIYAKRQGSPGTQSPEGKP